MGDPQMVDNTFRNVTDIVTRNRYSPEVDSSGGPPHDSDMEARVAKLEENYSKVLELLGRLDVAIAAQSKDVSSLKNDIAEIKGKLSHMPTMWSVAGTMLAINAGILALGFGLARILAGP